MAAAAMIQQSSRPDETNRSFESAEPVSEKTAPELSDFGEAPEGGVQGWLVAAGGFAIFFCCLGFSNAFGTFEEYYLTHQLQGESPSNVAWIGSLSAFLQFASGMVGGPLFDYFGAQVIRPAAIVYVFLVIMLSLCNKYWQFMLVQGILMGIVMGFLQFPAFTAVSHYFDKKRAAAFGVIISGSSVGGIVIPIASSKMLNSTTLGFGWSVRIIGFLMIPFMAFACVTVKGRLQPRKSTFWIPAAFKDTKFILLIFSLFFIFIGMWTPLFYLPSYAVERGMDPTLAGYLLAIINAASTFGRIIPGILADKYGRFNMFSIGALATGTVVFCLDSAKSNPALIVYAIVFGFSSGTIISGASAAFASFPKDMQDIGTYSGMGMSLAAFGGLIGPPVNGVFVDHYGGFFQVSMLSGAMCLLGGCIAVMAKLATPQGITGRV